MTLQDFKTQKRLIRATLEHNLKVAIANDHSEFKSCYETTKKNISIKFKEPKEAIKGKMAYVSNMLNNDITCNIAEITERPQCLTYNIGTSYTFDILTLREVITDRQVEQRMKNFIKNKLTRDTGNNYISIDCKIMELFKRGKIEWADVVEAHKIECSF